MNTSIADDKYASKDPRVWLDAAVRALTYVQSVTTPEIQTDIKPAIDAIEALLDLIKLNAGIDE